MEPVTLSMILMAVLAAAVVWLMFRAARDEMRTLTGGSRSVAYPRILKVCVGIGWGAAVALPLMARRHGLIDGPRSTALVGCLCVALILPLHLEVYGFRIKWDGYWLYTTSPWRKSRRIAINSVTRCDFSWLLLCYIIRTRKDGVILVSLFARGIPALLSLLPVECPKHPGPGPLPPPAADGGEGRRRRRRPPEGGDGDAEADGKR